MCYFDAAVMQIESQMNPRLSGALQQRDVLLDNPNYRVHVEIWKKKKHNNVFFLHLGEINKPHYLS